MKFVHRKSFLLVEGVAGSFDRRVAIIKSLEPALCQWGPATRISPIFCLENDGLSSADQESFEGNHYLIFVGPLPIEELELLWAKVSGIWLSLGLYNIILHTLSSNDAKAIGKFLTKANIRHEKWSVKDGVIRTVSAHMLAETSADGRGAIAKVATISLPPEVAEATMEYCPLMASTMARAKQAAPKLLAELNSLGAETARTLDDYEKAPSEEAMYRVLGQLLYVNAGLSRFASQTFSGTSPILETECHFWSHSLLGVGVASLALWNICRFIERTLGEARIPERFAGLAAINSPVPDLSSLDLNDPFWGADHLEPVELARPDERPPLVPLLAYFSARDGFKSTLTTISAPLACVSSCNTYQWSLLTLTHEISHIVTRSVLADLFPDLDSDEEIGSALRLVDADGPAGDLFSEIRRFLFFGILKMDDVAAGRTRPPDYDTDMFRNLLEHWHHDVEEIFAHVFDFLYFYGQDVEKYIQGIWTSWGTIPNINRRIKDYVVRTVCAVLPPQIRKGEQGVEIAKDQVRESLLKLQRDSGGGAYVSKAVAHIDNHWDEIKLRVYARLPLVKVVRTFLFSEAVATQVRGETAISGGASEKEGYTLRPGLFESKSIQNPVKFLEFYSQSKEPSSLMSAWILNILAFYTVDDEQ